MFVLSCLKPIGVFDSGVGGISVLRQLKTVLSGEDFVYLSDTVNAPYGTRSDEEIIALTNAAVKKLMSYDCKAIVLACNTVTAVAADSLRQNICVPIIGVEPAVKPAMAEYPNDMKLVLATPVTVSHGKLQSLLRSIGQETFITVAAPELVSLVEKGLASSEQAERYLAKLLSPYKDIAFKACVLGCTHFPFAVRSIEKALGYKPEFFDGSYGAAKRLRNVLLERDLLNEGLSGSVIWLDALNAVNFRSLLYSK